MPKNDRIPNLFAFAPISTWREVYHGRWDKLRTVQRIEFVVELAFFILFFGVIVCAAYLHNANFVGLVLAFGVVGALLGGFFLLLTRSIR